VLVVTKADLGRTAQRAQADLRAALRSLGTRDTAVVAVSSVAPPRGIEELVTALGNHYAGLDLVARRTDSRRRAALADFTAEFGERGLRAAGRRRAALRWLADQDPALDAGTLARRLQEHADP
jgi:LAO/AO transport system kinase